MKSILIIIIEICSILYLSGQDYAIKQLENSPRHSEWVQVVNDDRTVNCFVTYPEVATEATVVIVIHENRGLTDWVKSFADQLAAEGYITIAPDLLSDFAPKRKKTLDFPNSDEAREAIYLLDSTRVTNDLNAVQKYAEEITSGNGKTIVIGFCWGGMQSFRFACNNDKIKASLVFYGTAPESNAEIIKINAPVYGFYGGNDDRINSGIQLTEKRMSAAGKNYDYKIYEGAGHAYMRQGDDPAGSDENKKARNDSWERMLEILKKI